MNGVVERLSITVYAEAYWYRTAGYKIEYGRYPGASAHHTEATLTLLNASTILVSYRRTTPNYRLGLRQIHVLVNFLIQSLKLVR